MRFDVTKWTRLAAFGIIASAFLNVGCSSSSGWKMPSTKMFSWSKKPSESTLAGAGPSALKYPDSPASKQTPQVIASAAAGTAPSKASSTGSTAFAAGTGAKQPTFTPPNGMANVAFAPPAAAAAANGYSVGPYNTYSQPGAAAGAMASSGIPSSFAGGMSATAMSQSNPYNAASAGFPSTQTYSGVNPSTLAAGKSNVPPNGNLPAPVGGGFPSAPANIPGMTGTPIPNSFASTSSNPNPSFAPGAISPGFALPQTVPMSTGYAPVGSNPGVSGSSNSIASFPSGTIPTSGLPPIVSSGSSVPGQMAAYNAQMTGPGVTTTASFRPGSTGRQTNYDFSQPAASSTASSTAAGQGTKLPAANTATGLNNPGFQVPPAGTFR